MEKVFHRQKGHFLNDIPDRKKLKTVVHFEEPSHDLIFLGSGFGRRSRVWRIVDCREVEMKDGHKEKLIKLKNPWGFFEWKGKWHDKDECWEQVKDQELVETKLLNSRENDGIAWMPHEIYLEVFDPTRIAPIDNQTGPMVEKDRRYRKTREKRRRKVPQGEMDSFRFDGSWLRGVTFGGTDAAGEEFAKNPQYLITLQNSDGSGNMISFVPELTMKAKSPNTNAAKIKYDIFPTIEFEKKAENGKRYERDFFESIKPIGGAEDERMLLTWFTQLKPGSYSFCRVL